MEGENKNLVTKIKTSFQLPVTERVNGVGLCYKSSSDLSALSQKSVL